MSGAHVLVIEDDEWVARLLAVGLREVGHRVTLCTDGASGITTVHREVPDCVVCDVELPDIDGFAIGRSMRGAGGRVAATPLLFLCARDEEGDAKIEALRSGGDAYLAKPFRIDEVAWTVTALIRLAERNRGIGPISAPKEGAPGILSVPPVSEPPSGVLEGDLAKVSIATILTVLEMEKHTGDLEMTRGDRTARLHVETGNVDGGHLGETQAEPIAVLRTVLTWTGGRFRFAPSKKPAKPMSGRATIGALLMEAARLEDEFKAGITPRDKRISTLPPMSSRVNDLLGAAFPSTLPDPPLEPDSESFASPPPPSVAPVSTPGFAPATRATPPAAAVSAAKPFIPAPAPSPRPLGLTPKPTPRPPLKPRVATAPGTLTSTFPTFVSPTPPAGTPVVVVTSAPSVATPTPPDASATPPDATPPASSSEPLALALPDAISVVPSPSPTAAPEEGALAAPAPTELRVNSLVDDDAWEAQDEPATSLEPTELESARGGPPPVPPPPPPPKAANRG